MVNATNAVVLRSHPFSQDYGVLHITAVAGQTIQQMLDGLMDGAEIAPTVRVEIGGREVPRALWTKVRPKPGVALHVTRMPTGGDDGKKWLRTILMIVVAVVAIVAQQYWALPGIFAGSTGAIVFMVGDLRVPALIPEKI